MSIFYIVKDIIIPYDIWCRPDQYKGVIKIIENRNAYIAATIYAIIIGLSFMFVKVTLTVATPLDTLAHRLPLHGPLPQRCSC